ncbi:hypothetical protein IJJ12_02285 [bacterium]|nr:hypothetical protein [bacterium]
MLKEFWAKHWLAVTLGVIVILSLGCGLLWVSRPHGHRASEFAHVVSTASDQVVT